MRATHLLLVVPLGLAVLAAGVLPLEHLHRQPNATAPFVHSHFGSSHHSGESNHPGDSHQRSVSETDHDPHEATVGLGHTVGLGQTLRSDYAPSLAPDPVTLAGLGASHSVLSAECAERALSPPARQSIPRAPPA